MKTTTKLAIGSLKSGKIRSILSGAAIFLTTMLITVIALGSNAIVWEQKDSAAENFGEHYGVFNRLSPEQIETVELHSQFYNIGSETYAAEGICKGYQMNLYEMDSVMQMLAHFTIESGSYPQTENEILAQREFFKAFGAKKPKIGDTVTVSIRINGVGEIIQRDFVISGFLPSYRSNDLAKKYTAYVSKDFIEKNIPNKEERLTALGFQVSNEENLNAAQMETKIENLANEIGLRESQVGVNDKYLTWALDPGTEILAPGICIILIIMIVSALVIYNIFHVSIMQKIREYGRLKAIGANKKQLKKIVRIEGFILSAFTIPAGILFGILLLKICLCSLMHKNIPIFSLPLTIFVIILTLCTVFLSMHKPLKLASKISPVEAIRYEAGGKEQKRKGSIDVNIFKLTMSNLSLHKKRTATTILTMGLSCVLFVVIANIIGNMDTARQAREDLEYGRFRIEIDGELDDKTYPENNMNEIQKNAPFGKDFIKQLSSIPGVTDIRTRKQMEVYETNKNTGESFYTTIAVVNEEDFAWLLRNAERGVVDYDHTAAQDGVIYMWDYFLDENYSIGDIYQCEILDGDGRIPFSGPILGSCGYSNDAEITITEATFEKLGIKEDMTSIVFVDCSLEEEDSVREELEQITGAMENISLTCFEDNLKLLNMQVSFMKSACYTFLIILGMIGFMNMANTMITNILTRKHEFGIMQAIGMSNRQLNQMLQLEGLVFTIGTVLISFIFGNIFGYFAFLFCKDQGFVGLFEYRLPVVELSFLMIAIVGLQAILAFLLSKNVKKESLVERIRYNE